MEQSEDDIYNNNNLSEKQIPFPFEIKPVEAELNAKLLKDFTGERTGFVQVGPKKYFLPSGYAKEAQNFYNFQSRPGDVWVVSYPRSGTTWTQEMTWMIANDLDFKTGLEVSILDRFPFLEFSCFVHDEVKSELLAENAQNPDAFKILEKMDYPAWKALTLTKGPRFIKTHLPFSLLPPNLFECGCKVIYVARNPKDVCVSFFHLNRLFKTQGYQGDFKKYFHYFKNNLQAWTPYWDHLQEGWDNRDQPNMMFLFYEELSKNLRSGIQKVSSFLNKHYTVEQIEKLEEHLNIDNFRRNKSVSSGFKTTAIFNNGEEKFVRKGASGGWQDYFTGELNAEADEWIRENLAKSDLKFPQV